MFYCNTESDRDSNFIKAESLRIELIAGGLNWKQQEFIMDRLQPNAFFEVRTILFSPRFFVIQRCGILTETDIKQFIKTKQTKKVSYKQVADSLRCFLSMNL